MNNEQRRAATVRAVKRALQDVAPVLVADRAIEKAKAPKRKPKWQRDFEATDVTNQLQQVIAVIRKEPDKGGELARICRLAIKRIRFLEDYTEMMLEKEYKASPREQGRPKKTRAGKR